MSQLFTSGGPKYWSFSFSISPSSEYSGLIYFRIDWVDLLAVQGTLNSLLQHHNLKASLRCLRCLQDRCPTTEGSFWVLEKKSYSRPEIPVCDPWLSQNASFEEEESSVSGSSVHGIPGRILAWVAISSPGDFPDPGIELRSPALQADSLMTEILGKPT